jgi:hypothetical protein
MTKFLKRIGMTSFEWKPLNRDGAGNKKRGPGRGRVQLFDYKLIISFCNGRLGQVEREYICRRIMEMGEFV